MPRTKQLRNRTASLAANELSDTMVKDFELHAKMKLRKLEVDFDMMSTNLANQIDVALSRIPEEIRNMTLRQLLTMDFPADAENSSGSDQNDTIEVPKTVKSKKTLKRQTAASTDDGYVTESTKSMTHHKKHVSRIDSNNKSTMKENGRRTRSSTRSQTRQINSRVTSSYERRESSTSRINDKMYTPAVSKLQTEFSIITPKVKPNTPMNIMRRPKEGEMVLSMQGSPILVSAIVQERTANINVPLQNGNIISLLPNAGLRLSHMPDLDEETMRQLRTLRGHIEKVIGNK